MGAKAMLNLISFIVFPWYFNYMALHLDLKYPATGGMMLYYHLFDYRRALLQGFL
jgi:hypothetical protein